MDYLIHTVFLFTGSEKKEDEMLDDIPLTFLNFFLFLETIFVPAN